MHEQATDHRRDESGFTLVELLVVIVVVGILAAIAIPSFIGQKSKASDAQAKQLAHTAQTAAETSATDNRGSYTGVTVPNLNSIEPTLYTTAAAAAGGAYFAGAGNTASTYSVVTSSSNGDQYTVSRAADGTVMHSCTVASGNHVSGCVGGSW